MDNNNSATDKKQAKSSKRILLVVSGVCLIIYLLLATPPNNIQTEKIEYEKPTADIIWSKINIEKYDFDPIRCNCESVNTFYDCFFDESDYGIYIDNVRVSGMVLDIKTDATLYDNETKYTVLTISDRDNSEETLDIYFKDIDNCTDLLTSGEISVGREIECYVAMFFPKDEDLQDLNCYARPEEDVGIYYNSHDTIGGWVSEVLGYCNNLKNARFELKGAVYKIEGEYRLYADYERYPDSFVILESYDGHLATEVTICGSYMGSTSEREKDYGRFDRARAILGNIKIMENK